MTYLPGGQYHISSTGTGRLPYAMTMNITGNISMNFSLKDTGQTFNLTSEHDFTVNGAGVTIRSFSVESGIVNLTLVSNSSGFAEITVPFLQLKDINMSQILSSRVFLNGVETKNYTLAISDNYTVVLYLNTSGSSSLEWILNSSISAQSSHPEIPSTLFDRPVIEYATLGILFVILLVAVIVLRRR